VGAIRQAADGYESAGANAPRFSVVSPSDLPALPAAVEVAAYRIAQEALTNMVRHACAQNCRVVFSATPLALEVIVEDDGVGVPDTPRAGVGLASMRERAEELGGTLTIERLPEGGTRVHAKLPLVSS
jgi:signal transduction histidine kinase